MRPARQALSLARSSSRAQRRSLHQTRVRYAITNLEMPAMSPTMTEGGISSWKKREGESFSTGDVLLEIETDKATIDVEAQDDGILGKIIAQDGSKNIQVGKVIAILAEEGDDISNLEAPKEEPKPVPSPQPETQAAQPPPQAPAPQPTASKVSHHPKHSKHLLPSVIRLLIEGNVIDAEAIPGTGVRGMLTKGDVLAYLGRASSPMGTFKEAKKEVSGPKKVEEVKPLDGATIRQLIVSGLAAKTKPAPALTTPATFDAIIADYLPPSLSSPKAAPIPISPTKVQDSSAKYFDGLL
ncbi:pyruvate dehydrogenase X component [Suillus subalutaceus]|uniref:pyruvate dehydrogenase X component n=1 Tax=Suillus subalutaceus TaxID=48586 RepID=UPI001B85D8CB|nr:pyruvate dehydrogenase X component [Suillus subalutaceus]KAG1842643.1 pyruvate dehydrogenase X component [Suillus subalutaceus]